MYKKYTYKEPLSHQKEKKCNPMHLNQGYILPPLVMEMSLQDIIGNQEVQRMIKAHEIMAKLFVNQPWDIYEQEADSVAQQVINLKDKEIHTNRGEHRIQTKSISPDQTKISLQLEAKIHSLKGKGQPLETGLKRYLQPRFGVDLGDVRVHLDSNADKLARAIRARAFTLGNDIVFAKGEYNPGTHEGKKLVAHELTHVLQQRQNNYQYRRNIIQRRVQPEDIVTELIGQIVELNRDLKSSSNKSFTRGTRASILAWDNASENIRVRALSSTDNRSYDISVKKIHITIPRSGVSGISHYDTEYSDTRNRIESAAAAIETHKAKRDEYELYKNLEGYQAELNRLMGLQENRYTLLNQQLIRQIMYNRFDNYIKTWVDYYNREFTPRTLLGYNIVKSMLFEETRMGTSGEHLMLNADNYYGGNTDHPIKSIYNLGQSIDSYGPHQYLMIKEMAPSIYLRYNLNELEAQDRWKSYDYWNTNFKNAMREFSAYRDSSNRNLMGNSGRDLYHDYEFWIRAAVRWLFYKYYSLGNPSWSEAVRAYNGAGSMAEGYRNRVMSRAGGEATIRVGNE